MLKNFFKILMITIPWIGGTHGPHFLRSNALDSDLFQWKKIIITKLRNYSHVFITFFSQLGYLFKDLHCEIYCMKHY